MRKFAAHYLLTDTGVLLKNGIALVTEQGLLRFVDTKGDLRETQQLIFYNGLLISEFEFVRNPVSTFDLSLKTAKELTLKGKAENADHLSLLQVIELAKEMQYQHPEKRIPELLNLLEKDLLSEGKFLRNPLRGIYLLKGIDLANLHFTPSSQLKKIL